MKIKVPENTERETIYYSSNELGTSSLKLHVRSGYLVVRLEIEDIKDGNDVLLELESLYRIDKDEWTDIDVSKIFIRMLKVHYLSHSFKYCKFTNVFLKI